MSSSKLVQDPNTGNGEGKLSCGSSTRNLILPASNTSRIEMENPDDSTQSLQVVGRLRSERGEVKWILMIEPSRVCSMR